MTRRRVLQIAINDLEGARKRHAQSAHDQRQLVLDIFAIGERQRRLYRDMFENRPQFDLFVEIFEFVDALLQALGDRKVGSIASRPFAFATASARSSRS